MAFHKLLAKALIYNKYTETDEAAGQIQTRKKPHTEHTMMAAPHFAKQWTGTEWDTLAKNTYQQYVCSTPGCKKQIETHCKCGPGVWQCADCHVEHALEGVSTP